MSCITRSDIGTTVNKAFYIAGSISYNMLLLCRNAEKIRDLQIKLVYDDDIYKDSLNIVYVFEVAVDKKNIRRHFFSCGSKSRNPG